MSEPLMSVAGQLVGIPAEKYSGINGITVDQNNKTIGLDETYYTGYNATSGGVFTALANADIITDVRACRIGNLVMINGQINPMAKITIPSTTWTYIGTINDELKPSTNVYFPFTCVETQLTGALMIATDGRLSISQYGTSNGFGRYFSVAYSKGA
jgi:hypothetical protein